MPSLLLRFPEDKEVEKNYPLTEYVSHSSAGAHLLHQNPFQIFSSKLVMLT
jgi:hypothetical protein